MTIGPYYYTTRYHLGLTAVLGDWLWCNSNAGVMPTNREEPSVLPEVSSTRASASEVFAIETLPPMQAT